MSIGVGAAGVPASAAATPKSPVKHVFVVVLENASASEVASPTFSTTMPYLSSLAAKGVSLDQMYAIDHVSLGNYIGMTSGYEANAKTKRRLLPVRLRLPGRPRRQRRQPARGPAPHLEGLHGRHDPAVPEAPRPQAPPTRSQVGYATRHNPFMYYASIVDNATRCRTHVVPFPQLATDLAANRVPNYSFISPSTCNDAHDRGSACGLEQADVWMSQHVQPILKSKAYKDGGVLIITTDESEISDTSGCCGNAQGGHIATFVVSPLIAKPGSHTATPYSHYSTLRWIEDSFGLPCLRHACDPGTTTFGSDVFKAPTSVTKKTGTS